MANKRQTGEMDVTTHHIPLDEPAVTTESVHREIANLKDVMNIHFGSCDSAIKQSSENIEKLEALVNENSKRLALTESQFLERDKRTDQLASADKTAVAAALLAQKEATGAQNESNAAAAAKQEAAFTKLLDQNQMLFQTSIAVLTTQLNDLKSRLDKGEGQGAGRHDEVKDSRAAAQDNRGFFFGVVGMVISSLALIATITTVLMHK